jgi:hypothetical protein
VAVTIGPTPGGSGRAGRPDQPYAADLTVANLQGKIIARARPTDGQFLFARRAITCWRKASDDSPFQAAATFHRTAGIWTRLDVTLDSGIARRRS